MKAVHIRSLVVVFAALGMVSAGVAQDQFYDKQPLLKHSTLVDKDGKEIRDSTFADWMKGLLIKGTETNARDAKFMFAQCYGGGMLDDLESKLGGTVKWVGGSASRHDEPSIGQNDAVPGALDYWVKALLPELTKDGKVIDSINTARKNDLRGPNGTKKENPQSIYKNGGEDITLGDKDAKSHHAILWAGGADGKRHLNDIKGMYDKLKAAWKDAPNVTFTVLGNKADLGLPADANITYADATQDNLKKAVDDLQSKMNKDEQFLFFGSDHGGTQTDLWKAPIDIPTGGTDNEKL